MVKRLGILLAGGESRRFGKPKAFAPFKNKQIYEYIVEALLPLMDKLVVVSHPTLVGRFSEDRRFQVMVDDERYSGKGPLAGLYSVMTQVEARDYYVFPCDTPLVSQEIVQWLIYQGEKHPYLNGVVPIVEHRLQPLFGLYRKTCLPYLEELLESNVLKVRALVDRANILSVPVDEALPAVLFYNVNTLDELKEIET